MRPGFVAALIAVILAASPADARAEGQLLGEVQQTLRRGDRIRVIDHNGATVDGRFDGISGAVLRVVRKRTPSSFRRRASIGSGKHVTNRMAS
jgi:hypothetical protein